MYIYQQEYLIKIRIIFNNKLILYISQWNSWDPELDAEMSSKVKEEIELSAWEFTLKEHWIWKGLHLRTQLLRKLTWNLWGYAAPFLNRLHLA